MGDSDRFGVSVKRRVVKDESKCRACVISWVLTTMGKT